MKFEYNTVERLALSEVNYAEHNAYLNRLGENNWELVSVIHVPGTTLSYGKIVYFLKRQVS